MTNEEKKILEGYIYNIVKKTLKENYQIVNEDGENDEPVKSNNIKDNNRRRKIILKWLNNSSVNQTDIMRKLWHPNKKEEDSDRSLFFKKLHGEKNDNGTPYQFSDEEITDLFKIKSQGSIV